MLSVLGVCSAGGRIVASKQLFGATLNLFNNVFAKFGIEICYVEDNDISSWEQVAKQKAQLFFLESPSNPQLTIYDIKQIADLAHSIGALLLVDNCACTPYLQQPASLGADLVMHSGTKYLDGQGRVLGGVVCGCEGLIEEKIFPVLRCAGPSISPFNAWVIAKGLETLRIRIFEMSRVASLLVEQFVEHPKINLLRYPFHPSHPDYELAKRQQQAGGAIFSIEIKGGQEAAFRFINNLKIISCTANFGDAKSTVTHPASTTHSKMTAEEQLATGITPGLVRISVGLENAEDLANDISNALDKT